MIKKIFVNNKNLLRRSCDLQSVQQKNNRHQNKGRMIAITQIASSWTHPKSFVKKWVKRYLEGMWMICRKD